MSEVKRYTAAGICAASAQHTAVEYVAAADYEALETKLQAIEKQRNTYFKVGKALIQRMEAAAVYLDTAIELTPAEIQSGCNRVQWAEGLIRQLPEEHEGRNSWLLSYAQKPEGDSAKSENVRGYFLDPEKGADDPSTPVAGGEV